MNHIWTLPTLLILALGLIALNSGFCRSGFSLSASYKSLLVLFSALILHIVVFPFLFAILGRPLPNGVQEVQSLLFLAIAALIVMGAGVERLNPRATLLGLIVWQFLVYFPFLLVTQAEGFFVQQWGLRDFAGGLLVHGTAGASALGLSLAKGRRLEFFNLKKSSNLGVFSLGAGLILIGWLGFNASGAKDSLQQVAAIVNTLLAGATGFMTWSGLDRWHPPRRVSIKGGIFGMISGLVVITPGAGWFSVKLTLTVAILGTILAFYSALFVEKALRIDDEMKVFASHFIPSWIGALFVGIHFSKFQIQSEILLPLITGAYCVFATYLIFKCLKYITPITLSERQEMESPDLLILGESSIEV